MAVFALRNPHGRTVEAGKATKSVAVSSAPASTPASAHPSTPAPTSSASSTTAPGRLPLVVLNNTTTPGLAQQAKATFVAGGWTVASVGNLTNNIISTCAYYDPNYPGAQAAAAALQAQFPAIKRTAPKFAQLPAGPIVVVLTPDYSGN